MVEEAKTKDGKAVTGKELDKASDLILRRNCKNISLPFDAKLS